MARLEFIERLDAELGEERWLVQAAGADAPHVVWIFADEDREYLRGIEDGTRPWLGAIHPRVSTIFGSAWHGDRLVFEVDDDRGPSFAAAARQLTDPIARERWAVAQIIAIADGLATLRHRDREFVHRRLEPDRLFVAATGHARLRAPIALVSTGPRPGYVGMTMIGGVPLRWLSPEQCRGVRLTAASDVFGLATNLYLALAGKPPFLRDGDMDTLVAITEAEPPPLATHAPGLDAVLARAFAKRPDERYPDPGAFAGELWRVIPDATDYDAVTSDVLAAWWPTATPAEMPTRTLDATRRCSMTWDQLAPTGHEDVRHCGSCRQDVVRARSLAAVVPLVGKRCVAYDGGD